MPKITPCSHLSLRNRLCPTKNASFLCFSSPEAAKKKLCGCFTFPKRNISDSSKLKEFTDDSFELEEIGSKFLKWVENIVGKEEIARYEQFLLFPVCFQKTCTTEM